MRSRPKTTLKSLHLIGTSFPLREPLQQSYFNHPSLHSTYPANPITATESAHMLQAHIYSSSMLGFFLIFPLPQKKLARRAANRMFSAWLAAFLSPSCITPTCTAVHAAEAGGGRRHAAGMWICVGGGGALCVDGLSLSLWPGMKRRSAPRQIDSSLCSAPARTIPRARRIVVCVCCVFFNIAPANHSTRHHHPLISISPIVLVSALCSVSLSAWSCRTSIR